MDLVIGKRVKKVDEKWVGRWQFLSDFREEMGDAQVPWTYTSLADVDLWISLNKAMDAHDSAVLKEAKEATGVDLNTIEEYELYRQEEYERRAEERRQDVSQPPSAQRVQSPPLIQPAEYETDYKKKPLLLSKLDSIVSFMLPKSDRFLLYVTIDDGLRLKKVDYYRRLGEYIIRYGYSPNPIIFNPTDMITHLDDIRMILNVSEVLLDRLQDEEKALEVRSIQAAIRHTPLIRFYGILRNFYQTNKGDHPGDQWDEVRELCMTPPSQREYNRGITSVVDSTGGVVSAVELIGRRASQERIWLDEYMSSVLRTITFLPDFSSRPLSLLILTKSSIPPYINLPRHGLLYLPSLVMNIDPGREWYISQKGISTEYVRYIIECIDAQVDICEPHQLGWIASIVLGLGPVIGTSPISSTYGRAMPTVFSLLLTRMESFIHNVRNTVARNRVTNDISSSYPLVCETLASTMGTFYLNACAKCLLRLVEHNDTTGEEVRVIKYDPRFPDAAVTAYDEERRSIVLFIAAVLEEVGEELTLFTKWPTSTAAELRERLTDVKARVARIR